MADTEDSREKTRTAKREWMRAWRAANLERARERNRAWHAANLEKAHKTNRAWRVANPAKQHAYRVANREKINAARRAYRVANPEKAQKERAVKQAKRAENNEQEREKARQRNRAWRTANREKDLEISRNSHRKWRAAYPMLAAYDRHKSQAKTRNIAFLLTFEEWTTIWLESGKWEQRGRRKGQYVMARFGDVGPYEIGNVHICTCQENNAAQARYARARHDTSFL